MDHKEQPENSPKDKSLLNSDDTNTDSQPDLQLQHNESIPSEQDSTTFNANRAIPYGPEPTVEREEEPHPTRRSSRARKAPTDLFNVLDEPKTRKQKLSPACDSCRQKKIGCKHRSVLSNAGKKLDDKPAMVGWIAEGTEEERTLPNKKRKREFEPKDRTVERDGCEDRENSCSSEGGKGGEGELSSPLAKKALRVQRKREGGEDNDHNDESGTESQSEGESGPEPEPEPGALVHTERDVRGNNIRVGSAPTDSGGQGFPSLPEDSLRAAAQLSLHKVFSQELQEKLEECETRWKAAIASLHAAKEALDSWVEAWQKGF